MSFVFLRSAESEDTNGKSKNRDSEKCSVILRNEGREERHWHWEIAAGCRHDTHTIVCFEVIDIMELCITSIQLLQLHHRCVHLPTFHYTTLVCSKFA